MYIDLEDVNPFQWVVMKITRYLRHKNAMPFVKGERLLDLGCADGLFMRKTECKECVGIDRGIDKTVTIDSPNLKIINCDIKDKLNFKSDYFDTVTMMAFIEHLEHPQEVLNESCRVLKKDGVVIITTPFGKAEKWIDVYAPDRYRNPRYYHRHNFNEEQLKEMLKKAGFKVIHYNTFALGMNQLIVGVKG